MRLGTRKSRDALHQATRPWTSTVQRLVACLPLVLKRARYRQPTGPNPLNTRDDFGKPALRHGSLNSLFQVALYLPSYCVPAFKLALWWRAVCSRLEGFYDSSNRVFYVLIFLYAVLPCRERCWLRVMLAVSASGVRTLEPDS